LNFPKSGEIQVEKKWGGKREGAGRCQADYFLSLGMAKELAMVENNGKDRAVRLYLIKVEAAWNTPEAVMARALRMAQRTLDTYQQKIAGLQPKAAFFDTVADCKDALQMRDVAGVLNRPGWGRNKLFRFLREHKVLDGRNVPYREYEDRGYFRVIEQKWADSEGETRIALKTLVYQKGIGYIRRLVSQEIPQAEPRTEILVFPNTQEGAV
jgi:anti-repressor protein